MLRVVFFAILGLASAMVLLRVGGEMAARDFQRASAKAPAQTVPSADLVATRNAIEALVTSKLVLGSIEEVSKGRFLVPRAVADAVAIEPRLLKLDLKPDMVGYVVRNVTPLQRALGLRNGDQLTRLSGMQPDIGAIWLRARADVVRHDRVDLRLLRNNESIGLTYDFAN